MVLGGWEQQMSWRTKIWTSSFQNTGSAQGPPRGISLLGICLRAAVGRATGSLQDPRHGNPLFPRSTGDQDAVEDPLERRQVLPSEDAQHRAGF